MNTIYYPAIFHQEETGFSVSVPDIEGCFTQGDTMNEAVSMAQDAIGLMLEDAATLPAASDPRSLALEAGDFAVMVPFNMLEYKKANRTQSVKKTLSLPYWLNEAAENAHINFSGVLQEALKAKLNIG